MMPAQDESLTVTYDTTGDRRTLELIHDLRVPLLIRVGSVIAFVVIAWVSLRGDSVNWFMLVFGTLQFVFLMVFAPRWIINGMEKRIGVAMHDGVVFALTPEGLWRAHADGTGTLHPWRDVRMSGTMKENSEEYFELSVRIPGERLALSAKGLRVPIETILERRERFAKRGR